MRSTLLMSTIVVGILTSFSQLAKAMDVVCTFPNEKLNIFDFQRFEPSNKPTVFYRTAITKKDANLSGETRFLVIGIVLHKENEKLIGATFETSINNEVSTLSIISTNDGRMGSGSYRAHYAANFKVKFPYSATDLPNYEVGECRSTEEMFSRTTGLFHR